MQGTVAFGQRKPLKRRPKYYLSQPRSSMIGPLIDYHNPCVQVEHLKAIGTMLLPDQKAPCRGLLYTHILIKGRELSPSYETAALIRHRVKALAITYIHPPAFRHISHKLETFTPLLDYSNCCMRDRSTSNTC
jgi:hypothetical protein